jgi:hypothetical protein
MAPVNTFDPTTCLIRSNNVIRLAVIGAMTRIARWPDKKLARGASSMHGPAAMRDEISNFEFTISN